MLSTIKPLKDWTFEEIVAENQRSIWHAIMFGDLNSAIWHASDLAVRWRYQKSLSETVVQP